MSDLIKREDAIKELADYMYDVALLKADGRLNTTKHYLKLAEASLKHIPSANRPQGEWKAKSFHECFCEQCGFSFDIMKCDFLENMKFCPHCGARMKDVTEGLESRTDLIWYGDKTDLIGDETGRHTGWFGKGADDEDN